MPPSNLPEFDWTIVAAEGKAAEQLLDAQARAIREVLQWARMQPPSRSTRSAREAEVIVEED